MGHIKGFSSFFQTLVVGMSVVRFKFEWHGVRLFHENSDRGDTGLAGRETKSVLLST